MLLLNGAAGLGQLSHWSFVTAIVIKFRLRTMDDGRQPEPAPDATAQLEVMEAVVKELVAVQLGFFPVRRARTNPASHTTAPPNCFRRPTMLRRSPGSPMAVSRGRHAGSAWVMSAPKRHMAAPSRF